MGWLSLSWNQLGLTIAPLLLFSLGCEDLEQALKVIKNTVSEEDQYKAPAGVEAFPFLAITTAALTTDTSSVLEALTVGISEKGQANLRAAGKLSLLAEGDAIEVSDDAAKILEKIRSAKKSLDPDSYAEDDESILNPSPGFAFEFLADKDYSNDTVTMAEDEYIIPVLDKMPVRNQGARGTCAAFAGIGQLEGYILQNSTLESVDLSEQRFYALAKPDNWADGGDVNVGGSNAGTGFAVSSFVKTDYDPGFPDPSTYNVSNTYNIPLETQCPYVAKRQDNDLQSPSTKLDGCVTGVAQITDFESWHHGYKDGFDIDSAQSMYDHLKTKKYPVFVASKLSENWEENDGIITWADALSAGSTDHASGHAYLIVGARKLSEAEYPDEGGMCFIIKNSWGKGWGVNGLSCMTLAWFNHHRYARGYAYIKTATIDATTLQTQVAETDKKPDDVVEPDEGKKTIADDPDNGGGDDPNVVNKPRGRITFGLTKPAMLASDFSYGRLLSNDDSFYKVLYRVEGDVFYMRGILADGVTQTNNLTLRIDSDGVLSTSFKGKGAQNIGKLDSAAAKVVLCAQEYSEKCHFNYLKDSQELLVGLTEAAYLTDPSEGPYNWNYLGAGGKGIEISFPEGFVSKIDLRFSDGGVVTNPLRFRIDPIEGSIKFQGVKVGDYQAGELCSGDYKAICTLVRTKEQFLILFKSNKGATG